MSHFNNITSLTDALTIADGLSGGMIVYGFPLVVWIAVFAYSLPTNGRANSMAGASFVTLIIIFIFNMVGLLPFYLIIADLVLLTISVALVMLERRE